MFSPLDELRHFYLVGLLSPLVCSKLFEMQIDEDENISSLMSSVDSKCRFTTFFELSITITITKLTITLRYSGIRIIFSC